MVSSEKARRQVDRICLTKTIQYKQHSEVRTNLQYDTTSKTESNTYPIKAQVTVQNVDSDFVADGRVQIGDLVGLFRWQYDFEADGTTAISPILVPKMQDEIIFNSKSYSIKTCTPATLEDSNIIAWDFTAGYNGDE